jgi:hypothetical protein
VQFFIAVYIKNEKNQRNLAGLSIIILKKRLTEICEPTLGFGGGEN